jgi:hypothetical protein
MIDSVSTGCVDLGYSCYAQDPFALRYGHISRTVGRATPNCGAMQRVERAIARASNSSVRALAGWGASSELDLA